VKRYQIVALSALVCKSTEVVERRAVEAVGGEPAQRLHALAPSLEEATRPLPLRLECREADVHRLRLEPLALERQPDRRIAVPPPGERLRPRHRHPLVVDEADPLERLERLGPRPAGGAPIGEAGLEPLPRQVPMAERPRGDAERMRPAELASERARGLTVECAADPELGAHDRVGGNGAPRRPVEMDLDAPARPLPQRRDDRQR
jgi:hypothetical protein